MAYGNKTVPIEMNIDHALQRKKPAALALCFNPMILYMFPGPPFPKPTSLLRFLIPHPLAVGSFINQYIEKLLLY